MYFFQAKLKSRGPNLPLQFNIILGDPKLPRVPPLKVLIPLDYPEESPSLIDFKKDFSKYIQVI